MYRLNVLKVKKIWTHRPIKRCPHIVKKPLSLSDLPFTLHWGLPVSTTQFLLRDDTNWWIASAKPTCSFFGGMGGAPSASILLWAAVTCCSTRNISVPFALYPADYPQEVAQRQSHYSKDDNFVFLPQSLLPYVWTPSGPPWRRSSSPAARTGMSSSHSAPIPKMVALEASVSTRLPLCRVIDKSENEDNSLVISGSVHEPDPWIKVTRNLDKQQKFVFFSQPTHIFAPIQVEIN